MKKKELELFKDLSDEQAEKVVGGVGAGTPPGAGAFGWGGTGHPSEGHGLKSAGFMAPGEPNLHSAVEVTVPGPKGG